LTKKEFVQCTLKDYLSQDLMTQPYQLFLELLWLEIKFQLKVKRLMVLH